MPAVPIEELRDRNVVPDALEQVLADEIALGRVEQVGSRYQLTERGRRELAPLTHIDRKEKPRCP